MKPVKPKLEWYDDAPHNQAKLLSAIEDIGARSVKYLSEFGDGCTHTVKSRGLFRLWLASIILFCWMLSGGFLQ
ncbi:hypothetical protein [Neorhizobium sp. T6_25]|uniref:hypothetical protein n=1 Tax=Neorhizobium sp. T6_25 TaxID=2093833 RepID=UPI00155E4016|nr:hypothetical protein [Neorhizobium sp. T6_25]